VACDEDQGRARSGGRGRIQKGDGKAVLEQPSGDFLLHWQTSFYTIENINLSATELGAWLDPRSTKRMKAMHAPLRGYWEYKLTEEDVDAVQNAYRKLRAISDAFRLALYSSNHVLPSPETPGAFTHPHWYRPLSHFSNEIGKHVIALGHWLPSKPRRITSKECRKQDDPFELMFKVYDPAHDIIKLSGLQNRGIGFFFKELFDAGLALGRIFSEFEWKGAAPFLPGDPKPRKRATAKAKDVKALPAGKAAREADKLDAEERPALRKAAKPVKTKMKKQKPATAPLPLAV
jgi:hypothetical protein